MANQENGHWVTLKDGRKLFIEDNKAPRMSGYNAKTGAYQTKADKKADIIDKMRRLSVELDDPDNPNSLSRSQQSALSEYTRLERRLNKEYGMSEEEIFKEVIKGYTKEEDLVDKQEREIAEQQKFTSDKAKEGQEYQEKTEEEKIASNVDPAKAENSKTVAKQAVENLIEFQQEFEDSDESGISGSQSARDVLSASGLSDAEVDKVMSGDFDYSLACKFLGKLGSYNMFGEVTKERVAKILSEDYDIKVSGDFLNDIFKFATR